MRKSIISVMLFCITVSYFCVDNFPYRLENIDTECDYEIIDRDESFTFLIKKYPLQKIKPRESFRDSSEVNYIKWKFQKIDNENSEIISSASVEVEKSLSKSISTRYSKYSNSVIIHLGGYEFYFNNEYFSGSTPNEKIQMFACIDMNEGNVTWNTVMRNEKNTRVMLTAKSIDSANNFYLKFYHYNDVTLANQVFEKLDNNNRGDNTLVKINSKGKIVWSLNLEAFRYGCKHVIDKHGNSYIMGKVTDQVDVGGKSFFPFNNRNVFTNSAVAILYVNKKGKPKWCKYFSFYANPKLVYDCELERAVASYLINFENPNKIFKKEKSNFERGFAMLFLNKRGRVTEKRLIEASIDSDYSFVINYIKKDKSDAIYGYNYITNYDKRIGSNILTEDYKCQYFEAKVGDTNQLLWSKKKEERNELKLTERALQMDNIFKLGVLFNTEVHSYSEESKKGYMLITPNEFPFLEEDR